MALQQKLRISGTALVRLELWPESSAVAGRMTPPVTPQQVMMQHTVRAPVSRPQWLGGASVRLQHMAGR